MVKNDADILIKVGADYAEAKKSFKELEKLKKVFTDFGEEGTKAYNNLVNVSSSFLGKLGSIGKAVNTAKTVEDLKKIEDRLKSLNNTGEKTVKVFENIMSKNVASGLRTFQGTAGKEATTLNVEKFRQIDKVSAMSGEAFFAFTGEQSKRDWEKYQNSVKNIASEKKRANDSLRFLDEVNEKKSDDWAKELSNRYEAREKVRLADIKKVEDKKKVSIAEQKKYNNASLRFLDEANEKEYDNWAKRLGERQAKRDEDVAKVKKRGIDKEVRDYKDVEVKLAADRVRASKIGEVPLGEKILIKRGTDTSTGLPTSGLVYSEKFTQAFQSVVGRVSEAKESFNNLNNILKLHQKEIDPNTVTALKRWRDENEKVMHGLDSGRLNLRNFGAGLKMIKNDIVDLMMWQMKWYGTKMLIYKPLEWAAEGLKYATQLDKIKSALLRYPAMEGDVTSEDKGRADALTKRMRQISVAYGIPVEELNKSADRLYSAGVKYSTIMASLPMFAKLQITYPEIEMEKFTTALVGFLNVFRKTPGLKELEGDAARLQVIVDKLVYALAKGVIAPKDITQVIQYLGQPGAMAGFNIDQLMAMSIMVTNYGDKANRASRSMRGLMESLQSEKVLNFLDKIGIKVNKDLQLGEQFFSLMAQLQKKAGIEGGKGISVGLAETLGKIAPVERAKPLQLFISYIKELEDSTNDMAKSQGALGRSFNEVSGTIERKQEILKILSKEIWGASINSELFKNILDATIAVVKLLGFVFSGLAGAISLAVAAMKNFMLLPLTDVAEKTGAALYDLMQKGLFKTGKAGDRGFNFEAIGEFYTSQKKTFKDAIDKGIFNKEASDQYLKEIADIKQGVINTQEILFGGATPFKDLEDKKKEIMEKLKNLLTTPSKGIKTAAMITPEKRERQELIAIEKSYASLRQAIWDVLYKNGIVSAENYYNKITALADASYQKELGYAKEYRARFDVEFKANLDKEIAANKGNVEKQDQLREDFNSKELEADRKIIELENNYLKERLNKTQEFYDRQKELLQKHLDNESELRKTALDRDILVENSVLDRRGTLNEWLYNKNRISSDKFYADEKEKANTNYENVIKKNILDEKDARLKAYQTYMVFSGEYGYMPVEKEKLYNDELLNISSKRRTADLTGEQTYLSTMLQLKLKQTDDIKNAYKVGGAKGVVGKAFTDIADEYRNTAQQIYDTTNNIVMNMENSFADFFDYTSEGFMNWGNLVKGILNDIYKEILRTFLMKQIVGGIMGGVGSWWNAPSEAGALAAGFEGRAGGGRVSLNRSYIVGEKGPELYSPDSSGTITPNNQLGFGQPIVNVAINVENQTGQQVNMETKGIKFDTDKIVVNAVLKNIGQYGELYHIMQRR